MPGESDLMGLDISCYGERCPERRLAKPQEGYPDAAEDFAPLLFIVALLSIVGGLLYWILK